MPCSYHFFFWPQGSSFERAEFKRRNATAVGDNNAAQQSLAADGAIACFSSNFSPST
jgi:hypothetical protein